MSVGCLLARIGRSRRGNVSILMAGGLVMLTATSALGIDTASLFLEKRRLQGVADAAAIAAADDPSHGMAAAAAVAARTPGAETRVVAAEAGRYANDPALAPDARFVRGSDAANAARVSVEGGVSTIFGRALGLRAWVPITAVATAARIDTAAISIGSRLAALDGGLANAVLSELAGADLQLSIMDYSALASGQVDLLSMIPALRTRLGLHAASFGDVLEARASLPTIVEAMADGAGPNAATLRDVARRLPHREVRLRDVIDLGPLAEMTSADPKRPIRVGTLALLREAVLIGGQARTVRVALAPTVPGIAAVRLRLEIGERPARSGWLSVGRARTVTVRTAQTRVAIDATLAGSAPLGLGTVRVPLVAEAASGEATLAALDCSRTTGPAATLDVLPGVAQVAIAEVDDGSFASFTTPLSLRPPRIIAAPLASVTAWSSLRLAGTDPQRVRFDAADVASGAPKSVSTTGMIGGLAASLVRDADVRVTLLGLGLTTSAITAAVGSTLSLAAPSLDALIDGTAALAGVRVGAADVWVNGLRCGVPVLVG